MTLPKKANEPIPKLNMNNGTCNACFISSQLNARFSCTGFIESGTPSPTKNGKPNVTNIENKDNKAGKRSTCLFFAKSIF